MESAYWPGNEKERVATELTRHGGMRYMMSGPRNETSCELYKEIQQLAWLTASREIAGEAAKVTNTKPSHYSWSPATRREPQKHFKLEFRHSGPFRH